MRMTRNDKRRFFASDFTSTRYISNALHINMLRSRQLLPVDDRKDQIIHLITIDFGDIW